MQISTVMSRPVISVLPVTTVRRAAMLMRRHDVGALPVLVDDCLVGIVTDRDIVVRLLTNRSGAENHPVGDAMTRDPVTCYADQTIAEAAALMGDEQIRRLPVVDRSDGLVGILSIGDIAEGVSEALAGEALGEVTEERALKAFDRPVRRGE